MVRLERAGLTAVRPGGSRRDNRGLPSPQPALEAGRIETGDATFALGGLGRGWAARGDLAPGAPPPASEWVGPPPQATSQVPQPARFQKGGTDIWNDG